MSASILKTCKLQTRWAFEYFDQTTKNGSRSMTAVDRGHLNLQHLFCLFFGGLQQLP